MVGSIHPFGLIPSAAPDDTIDMPIRLRRYRHIALREEPVVRKILLVTALCLPLLGIAYLLLNGLWYVLAGLLLIPALIFFRKTQIAGAFRG